MAVLYDIFPHMNGSLPCVVDVETTSTHPIELLPIYNPSGSDIINFRRVGGEVIQIALVPLDIHLQPIDQLVFYSNICPEFPELVSQEAMAVNGLNLLDLQRTAPSRYKVVQMVENWFASLQLPSDRRLIPIAHNWPFEKTFLQWMFGRESFEAMFHYLARDTMQMALMLKDKAAFQCHKQPFNSVGLASLCKHYNVENENPHDALSDCYAQARVLQCLLKEELAL